jgi:tetratricopeptide (TPR) repeat protein
MAINREVTLTRLRPESVRIALVAVALLGCILGGLWWWSWSHRSTAVRDARAAAARGRSYLRYGRPDLAFQGVQDVRDEEPGAAEAVAVAAQALIRMREYRLARLTLERLLKLDPKHVEALSTLAELNLDLGNGGRAAELLTTAAELRPGDERIWLALGKVLRERGEHSRAIPALEKVLALNPSNHPALIQLLGALLDGGQADRAGPWVAKGLQRYPEDPAILGLAALGAIDANRPDEALALSDRALARDPENVHALRARARSFVARSQWPQALPCAERAATVSPNDLGMLQLLSIVQTRLGLTERAAATQVNLTRARERVQAMNELMEEIARQPDDPQLPWKLGRLARQSGMIELASGCFEAALSLDPAFRPAHQDLAALRAAHPRQVDHASPKRTIKPPRERIPPTRNESES